MKALRHLLPILLCLLFLCACAPESEGDIPQLDVSNPEDGVVTAAELLAFFSKGEGNTVKLAASIDLGDEMLRLSATRGSVAINGNGYTITSTADCVIRLEEGSRIALLDLNIKAGGCGIGCLEDASIYGKNLTIYAVADGIQCAGDLRIEDKSHITVEAARGNGLRAKSIDLGADSYLVCTGGQSAVNVTKNDLTLEEGVYLSAVTGDHYNAIKCGGDLIMRDGASLYVENLGEYHGAEVSTLRIEGIVTIMAKGGDKGVGLFLFTLRNDYKLLGYCEPEARFESGKGSLSFVSDAAQIQTAVPEEANGGS